MSLFKARDWWTVKVGENEEFDVGCLAVGNISNVESTTAIERIAVGSLSGILRIYNPHHEGDGFKPEQVLLEQNLGMPILQLACGKFVTAVTNVCIAVLHPRRLSVYTLLGTAGAVSHGSQYKLQHVYSHNLQRTSYNMCHGPFGQVKANSNDYCLFYPMGSNPSLFHQHLYPDKVPLYEYILIGFVTEICDVNYGYQDKDFICVQSMDGTLSVYEQESFSFTRFLPDSLLPGPLAYVAASDSFVTVSSARNIESYKYQTLAVATETKTKEDAQNLKSGKRVAADWTLCVGEQAIQIEVLEAGSNVSVLVLGERSVYCVTEFGKLKFMKKLEYTPRCMRVNRLTVDSVNYMVATQTNTLMVYSESILKWAAQLSHTPVHIDYCSMNTTPGGVVRIDEQGNMGIHYLGTDPAMMVMPSLNARETKYDEYQSQTQRYQQIIREKSGTQAILPSKLPEDELKLTITVPPSLDSPSQAEGVEYNDEDPVPSLTVKIEVKVKMMTQNVRVNLYLDKPLVSQQTEFDFSSISTANPAVINAPIFMKHNFLPASLRIKVSATYINSSGSPRITQTYFPLPLKLVVKAAPPVKSAMYKVTIDTNKPPVNLNDVFPDLLGMNAGGQGAALGFQFYGGPVITLLASKTSQRYRVQADDFASMWLITKDLIDRLHSHFGKHSGLECTHSSSLPLQEFFESLDAHFEYRVHAMRFKELLEQKALQFRAIQRRLLTRFKDKTPSPLSYLDTLLEGTFRQMIAIAEHAEDNKRTLYRASTNLSSAIHLLNYLIKLTYDMSEDDFAVLQSILNPDVNDNGDQGWEEIVDTTLTHQLRTKLAKTVKDQNVNIEMLGVGSDTDKIKKHIAIFVERLAKGIKLSDSNNTKTEKSPKASDKIIDKRNIAEPGKNAAMGALDTPIGTKFGEKLSPRATLGKPKSLRSGGSGLPPMNGSASENDIAQLPPLQGGAKLKPIRGSRDEVPDLDELTNGSV